MPRGNSHSAMLSKDAQFEKMTIVDDNVDDNDDDEYDDDTMAVKQTRSSHSAMLSKDAQF